MSDIKALVRLQRIFYKFGLEEEQYNYGFKELEDCVERVFNYEKKYDW